MEVQPLRMVPLGAAAQPKPVYPAPILSNEEVCRDRSTFLNSLRTFHNSLGLNFRNPVIRGEELDLHRLYVLVTLRGGIRKVVSENWWPEVVAVFYFPRTITCASSYGIRKYYVSLLFHFEQVYYFRTRGPLADPSGLLDPHYCLLSKAYQHLKTYPFRSQDPEMVTTRRKRSFAEAQPQSVGQSSPHPATNHQLPTVAPSITATPTGNGVQLGCSPTLVTTKTTSNGVPATSPILVTPATAPVSGPIQVVHATTANVVPAVIPAAGNELLASGAGTVTVIFTPATGNGPPTSVTVPVPSATGNVIPVGVSYSSAPTGNGYPAPVAVASTIQMVAGTSYPSLANAVSAPSTGNGNPITGSTPSTNAPGVQQNSRTITGIIDGNFEHGYLVTMTVNGQILRGVLHRPINKTTVDEASSSTVIPEFPPLAGYNATGSVVVPASPPGHTSESRNRELKYRDSPYPKPNRSAYIFFFAEKYPEMRVLHPHSDRESIELIIRESWSQLTEEERDVYYDKARRDKERYRSDMLAYRDMMNLMPQTEAMTAEPKDATSGLY